MLRLHDFAASANCFKVRMLLSQLDLPYERVPTDIFAGDSQTDEYLARNPAGRTPLLEVDGGAIPESGAILLYLAEGTPFLPDDPHRARARARVDVLRAEPARAERRHGALLAADRPRRRAARGVRAPSTRPVRPRWRRSSEGSRGRTSSSAGATPSRTARSTPTRAWRTRRATTWLPTRASRPGSSASPRRRARSTISSRTRPRRTPGRVGGRRTTRPAAGAG